MRSMFALSPAPLVRPLALVLGVACLLAGSDASADPNRRTLIVAAHQDDDLSIVADIADRFAANEAVTTVYLTSGDANTGCSDYVKNRETGVKHVYASLAGHPNAPECSASQANYCWSSGTQQFLGRTLRVKSLVGTNVKLMFFGFNNPGADDPFVALQPSLERLWSVAGATLTNQTTDGRSVVDTYNKTSLIDTLLSVVASLQPTHVETLDPNRNQLSIIPFDHSDHIHTAHFALAALQRHASPVSFKFHRGYNIMFEPENMSAADKQWHRSLRDIYQPHDDMICKPNTTKALVCDKEYACFDPAAFDMLEGRRYSVDPIIATDRSIGTPGGLCLDVIGSAVYSAPCLSFLPAQHWDVLATGQIRNRDRGTCVSSNDGLNVNLAACQSNQSGQRFLLLSNGQLKGPTAQCLTETLNTVHLELCGINSSQAGYSLR